VRSAWTLTNFLKQCQVKTIGLVWYWKLNNLPLKSIEPSFRRKWAKPKECNKNWVYSHLRRKSESEPIKEAEHVLLKSGVLLVILTYPTDASICFPMLLKIIQNPPTHDKLGNRTRMCYFYFPNSSRLFPCPFFGWCRFTGFQDWDSHSSWVTLSLLSWLHPQLNLFAKEKGTFANIGQSPLDYKV